jgi:hypothetical protein
MDDAHFWERNETQDAFGGFLQVLLDQHWSTIASDANCRGAFMHFALKLTALQHPLGSELTTIAGNRLGGQN